MLKGLLFDEQPAIATSAPTRMDIACFIGFVRPRPEATLPAPIVRWLDERGWISGPYRRPIEGLRDIPIPIETWDTFDRVFDWDHRTVERTDHALATDLGAAVRSFFTQGGKTCYIVSVGDPWPVMTPRAERLARLDRLLPGSSYADSHLSVRMTSTPADRASWSGAGLLFGLPDVSFVCLPDLPAIVGLDPVPLEIPPPPSRPERFVECSEHPLPPADHAVPTFTAPRCNTDAYAEWARIIEVLVQDLMTRYLREQTFIAAVPLPAPGLTVTNKTIHASHTMASPFLQLCFPWCRTSTASRLPGGVESPDGILTGVLARNALRRGTFRSAAHWPLVGVTSLDPMLSDDDRHRPSPAPYDGLVLDDWISVLGPTPSGFRLRSDVTTSVHEHERPGGVSRLINVIRRVAREVGDDLVFEPSSERVWARLREAVEHVLFTIWQTGGLRGRTPDQAFHVRCDRSTMSQHDLDSGRVIAHVQFAPALPIDTISVILAVDEGGAVSLSSPMTE